MSVVSRKMWRGTMHRAAVLCVFLMIISSTLVYVGPAAPVVVGFVPSSGIIPCRNDGVLMLFARGSNQKYEDPEARTFLTFVNAALSRYGVPSVGVELGKEEYAGQASGRYPAVDVDWNAGFIRYHESVSAGASELTQYVSHRVNQCPRETIVLGGFSQGADVVGYALQTFGPAILSRIGFVALYGDPRFSSCGQSWWARGSALRCVVGGLTITYPRTPYLPAALEGGAGSWCDAQDFFCTVNPVCGPNRIDGCSHGVAYREAWISRSVAEIAFRTAEKVLELISRPPNPGADPKLKVEPNTILRNPDNGASWLIGSDGYRRWIPTGGDYLCFVNQGSKVVNLPQSTIDTIPDRVGVHAKCTPGAIAAPPPPTAPPTKPPRTPASRPGIAWLEGTRLFMFAGADLSTAGYVDGIGRPDWAGAGDYNRDGREDLFWYHAGNDTSIYVLLSTGDSFKSIGRAVRGPGVGKPTWAATGDFNGDGYRNEVAWLEGTDLFMFSGTDLSTVSTTTGIGTPDWAGVGDYDGDKKDDLFWYHGGTDSTIYVLRSDGKGFSSVGPIRGPGVGTPSWAGVGDFDGDGRRDDLAWNQGDTLFTFCGQHLADCGKVTGIANPTWASVVRERSGRRDALLWFHKEPDGSFYLLEMWPGTNNFRSTGRVRGPGVGAPLVAVGGKF